MKIKPIIVAVSLLMAFSLSARHRGHDYSPPLGNRHWNFDINTYKTEITQETPLSGKFVMWVKCTGILKGFNVLEGVYSATPIGQVEALLKSDVMGNYKGRTLRLVSTALVNISTGSYEVQEITVSLTARNGKELTTDNVQVQGGFEPYDMTFQSLVSDAAGSFELPGRGSHWACFQHRHRD